MVKSDRRQHPKWGVGRDCCAWRRTVIFSVSSRFVQVRATWPGHVVRRALDDVMSGLQPTWPNVDAERAMDADWRTVQQAVNARNACDLYTQRLTGVIGSKVKRSVIVFLSLILLTDRRDQTTPCARKKGPTVLLP